MEELESFFEVFFAGIVIVISMIASAKKAKNKRIADAAKQSRTLEQAASQAARSWTPSQPTVQPSASYADVPVQVIAPTVHPHVEPDCAIHDIPGSLGVTTMEGKDPCHEEQLTLARSVEESATEKSGLTFDWTGSSMVKAVVMQEVLQRPVQRRAR